MIWFILLLLLCSLFFLFYLYHLAREDLVLLRRGLGMEQIFNLAFLVFGVSIFAARVFFVFSHPNVRYLNPLVFLLFPYFPGLSLIGGVLGGLLFLWLFSFYRLLPFGRLLDFFALSFLFVLPVGLMGNFILRFHAKSIDLLFAFIYFLLFVFFWRFFLHKAIRGEMREGSVGYIFLIHLATISLLAKIIFYPSSFVLFNFENIILWFLFLLSIFLLLKNELQKTKNKHGA